MILKVSPITLADRIEHLLATKRYEECLLLISKQPELNVPIETIIKVENSYLEHLLKTKEYHKLKELMPKFICENRDRWEHFLNRLMQKKILIQFIELIPVDRPRLNLKFYTKIFEYFLIDTKDYQAFLSIVK